MHPCFTKARVRFKRYTGITVHGSPKHLLLRAYESENEVASGDSGCEASPDASLFRTDSEQ